MYKNNRTKCVKLEYWAKSGEKKYPHYFSLTWILRTTSSEKEIPVQAQIATDKYCHKLTVSIPILSNIPDKKLTYGVCLHQGLFTLKNSQILVDWVELNLALGAEIITVYLQDVLESFYNLMLPYIKKGVVEVLDWSLKPPLIPTSIYFYGQYGLINECIYRNLYRVKYLALIDVDEFIVPQQTSSVIEMLQTLEKTRQKVASYIFYNTVMYKGQVNLPEVKSANKCSNMTWPRYYTHTLRIKDPVAQNKWYPFHKIIVKPQAVISGWVHWVVNTSAGYDNSYSVPADVGLTFHYREPPGKKAPYFVRKAYYKKKKKQCFLMSHFFQQTYKGIKRTMCPAMY